MAFHSPFMLWGLSALLIPIIIHLFNLRRASRVYFSHLPFLKQVAHTTRIHTRIQRLFLLLVRLLALSALIFAFAQPYLSRLSSFSPTSAVLFYIDNSYSMESAHSSGEILLEKALYQATQLLQNYPPHYTFFVLSNEVHAATPLNKEEALDALSVITPTHLSMRAQILQQHILSTLKNIEQRADVYWFSDLQVPLFKHQMLTLDTLHRWHIFPLSATQPDNLFIDTAYIERPMLAKDVPNKVCIRVRNEQKVPCKPCIIQFFVKNKPLILQTIQLAPQQVQEICFNYTPSAQARALVQIQGPRPLFDNTFYLTLQPSPPIRVLEIASKLAPPYISYVYAQNERFVYQHLLPKQAAEGPAPEADLIILHALPQLSSALQERLVEALNKGKTILIIPSESLSAAQYTTLLPHLQRLEAPLSSSAFTSLQVPETADPFFRHMFTASKQNFSMPKAKPLYTWQPSDRHTLLSFADGKAFLSKSRSSGTCYLFTSPFTSAYTDFMHHPLFVPVFYKIATLSQHITHTLYFTHPHQSLQLSQRMLPQTSALRMQYADTLGQIYPLIVQKRGTNYQLKPKTWPAPGFYRLMQDTSSLFWVAYNHMPEESNLRPLSKQEQAAAFAPLRYHTLYTDAQAETMFETFKPPIELWRYFLMLSFMLLCVEIALLRYL